MKQAQVQWKTTAAKVLAIAVVLLTTLWGTSLMAQRQARSPDEFLGFHVGTDGELARWPQVIAYLQHLAGSTDRVAFSEIGKTTMGNPYVQAIFTSAENLKRIDRIREISNRLADPRNLSQEQAQALIQEGRPIYLLFATIHSSEIGNGQAILEVAHTLATSNEPRIREILDNAVLVMIPSQNPDGQVLLINWWYKYRKTKYNPLYPDLYHKYVGHDDNRDWFMFSQIETRLAVEKVQNVWRPQVTHDMHQMGSGGSRIFVPPYIDPYDPWVNPSTYQAGSFLGMSIAAQLIAEGKSGVAYSERYDLWTPARAYMLYHGSPRILTEIASARFAMPYVNPRGKNVPLGPQEKRWNFPQPYRKDVWKLRDIIDYGYSAVLAGLSNAAKYREYWLTNFYKIHKAAVEDDSPPFAFIIPRKQRDTYSAYELLQVMDIADVEIHESKAEFSAGGKTYPRGTRVILTRQPYGSFAKTMLTIQKYPDLRQFPGGPPIPPYDVAGQTLWMLMGVRVIQVDHPFEAPLRRLKTLPAPTASIRGGKAAWGYVIDHGSNASFMALNRLQKADVPVYWAARSFHAADREFPAGAMVVPAKSEAHHRLVAELTTEYGLDTTALAASVPVQSYRLKTPTRVGLWKGANNMSGGWDMWLLEKYGFQFRKISSTDFEKNLSELYDVILFPSGTSKQSIVDGLDPTRTPEEFRWAYGVGETGWEKLKQWVRAGGTIVAQGSADATVKEMFNLPLENVLPRQTFRRFGGRGRRAQGLPGRRRILQSAATGQSDGNRLRTAFQSPATLLKTLENVVPARSLFYCPGSLLANEVDLSHPIGFGLEETTPVFFRNNSAYRLKPSFSIPARVVARYPEGKSSLLSGWLLGEKLLRDQVNGVEFDVGKGKVIVFGTLVSFRAQTRGTYKLLFNSIFYGPATEVSHIEP